jgi:hypothetical protein
MLNDAIDAFAVVILRGQSLDDDRLLGLGRLFGETEPPRNHRVARRLKRLELANISNLDVNNRRRARD